MENSLLAGPYTQQNPRRVICVFCGSAIGKSSAHKDAAHALAQKFHENNITLVYGGGTRGLMGEVAKALVSLSGPEFVHGIIPRPLIQRERHTDSGIILPSVPSSKIYGRTTIVNSMHERKQLMVNEVLSGGHGSGFIALPGGYGTFEELMEIATWNQLGIHDRGVVVFNVNGYWNGLLNWIKDAVGAGFVKDNTKAIIREAKTANECIEALRNYKCEEGRSKLTW